MSLRSLGLLASVEAASAYSWRQTAGNEYRAGMWPPLSLSTVQGITAVEEEGAPRGLQAPAVPVPVVVASLQHSIGGLTYELRKDASPVIAVAGTVIIATPTCDLYGLADPEAAFETWNRPYFTYKAEDNPSVGTQCDDLILTEDDLLVHVVAQNSLLDNDTVVMYDTGFADSQLTLLAPFPVDTNTAMPRVELFSTGSLYTKPGRLWMPSTPLLSQVGVAQVNTQRVGGAPASGVVTPFSFNSGPDGNYDHGAGSVAVPDPQGGADLAVFVIAGSADYNGLSQHVLQALGPTSVVWQASVPAIASANAPHPNYVPGSPGRVYAVIAEPGAARTILVCVMADTGVNCPGTFPAPVATALDGYATGWWYAGALVPSPSGSTINRLLYTVDLGNASPNQPVGCMVALSPLTGSALEHYCVPRDMFGRDAALNYLATAPVVYVNARGTGLHTAFVVQYDSIVLAFDPANLGAGILYARDPIKPGDKVTCSTDYLTVAHSGALLFVGWREGSTDSEFVVTAVRGVAALPTPTPSPAANTPTPGGLSPAAAGSLSVFVLLGVAAGAFVYRSGGVSNALDKSGLSGFAGRAQTFVTGGGKYQRVNPYASTAKSFNSGSYGSTSSSSSTTNAFAGF